MVSNAFIIINRGIMVSSFQQIIDHKIEFERELLLNKHADHFYLKYVLRAMHEVTRKGLEKQNL